MVRSTIIRAQVSQFPCSFLVVETGNSYQRLSYFCRDFVTGEQDRYELLLLPSSRSWHQQTRERGVAIVKSKSMPSQQHASIAKRCARIRKKIDRRDERVCERDVVT